MSTERLPLCWIDLKTTGLDHHDPILEVACILTDPAMTVELGSYQQVVNPDLLPLFVADTSRVATTDWRRRMDDVVLQMHTANGLLYDVEASLSDSWTAGYVIARMMKEQWHGRWRLAGSGVAAFDLHVLRAQMPMVADLFHYAPLDVGQTRRMLEYALRDDVVPAQLTLDGNPDSRTLHRAMDDLRLHLAEGRHYRDALLRGIEPLLTAAQRRHRGLSPAT